MAKTARPSWWALYDCWELDRVQVFDTTIDNFETAWEEGLNPTIESIISEVKNDEHSAWLAELLAVEIIARSSRGENLLQVEFLKRFPGDAEIVRTVWALVFPLSAAVECRSVDKPAPDVARESRPSRGKYLSDGEILDGRYRVEKFVLRGGMGELYRAQRLLDAQTVAVKVMRLSGDGDDENFRARFVREKKILTALRHEHLVSAIEPLQIPRKPPMIVMDWIDGQDLQTLLRASGPLPVGTACEIIRQAALGLGCGWRRLNLVHRDIKPANLMLTYAGETKVLDFGLARAPLLSESDGHSLSEFGFGTPEFMAPEQWVDVRSVTAATDVYSLGCTLFFLLTGEPPFSKKGRDEKSLGLAHQSLAPPNIIRIRQEVKAGLAALLNRMLAKDPQDRPQDGDALAGELAKWTGDADLKRWISGKWSEPQFLAIPRPNGEVSPLVKPESSPIGDIKNRRLLLASAGVLLIGAAGGVAWTLRPGELPPPQAVDFDVTLYRPRAAGDIEKFGVIGKTVSTAQVGNQAQLLVRFDAPAHFWIVAASPRGELELVAATGNDKSAAKHFIGSIKEARVDFELDARGLQAFVVIASRSPLPAFETWQAKAKLRAAWSDSPGSDRVWAAENRATALHAMLPEGEAGRGAAKVPASLEKSWDAVRDGLPPGADAIVVGFPVVT